MAEVSAFIGRTCITAQRIAMSELGEARNYAFLQHRPHEMLDALFPTSINPAPGRAAPRVRAGAQARTPFFHAKHGSLASSLPLTFP